MKCFYHERRNAVATCQNCGKGLCKECASKNTPCVCEECVITLENQTKIDRAVKKEQAIIDTKEEFISAIIKGVVALVIGIILYNGIFKNDFESFEIMFFFLPFGWAVFTYLEQFMPVVFVSGFIYLIIIAFKFTFSLILGVPCFIYQVIKFIVKIIYHKNTN